MATAVAASAALPLLLPALERRFTFTRGGQDQQQTVLLTDGGVYDNLGLSGLEPGRDSAYTDHVYETPYIIACDAGLGGLASKTPHFLVPRLKRSFEIIHQRDRHDQDQLHNDHSNTARRSRLSVAHRTVLIC